MTDGPSPSGVGTVGQLSFFDEFGNVVDLEVPGNVLSTGLRPSFSTWKRGDKTRTYILGQMQENIMATEQKYVLRMQIQAPSGPWVNSGSPIENQVGIVASGTGLTGECIFYRRFVDSLHNRRSPLSGPSMALTLANQGVSITNAEDGPTPADAGVDQIEIWVSQDGGLPRFLATRDIGAPAFLVNEDVTGEAETDPMVPYPLLKYGVLANDALFAAGDPRFPNLLYVSFSGNPEEFTGITIPTRNGEAIIGLASIGGSTVYVQCQNSSYYVQGFDESDLIMKILEPNIGGLGHHLIGAVHDMALVLTQLGWYLCTGTSLIPFAMDRFGNTWRKTIDYRVLGRNPGGFVVTDYVGGVIKYLPDDGLLPSIIGFPTIDSNGGVFASVYWVLGVEGLSPDAGPGEAPLSFDATRNTDTAAAMLTAPGQLIGSFYTGDFDGDVYIENVPGNIDGDYPIQFLWHGHQHQMGEIAEESDAFKVSKVWPLFQCERFPTILSVYAGNDFAWQTVSPRTFTIPAGLLYNPVPADPLQRAKVPRSQRIQSPEVSGSCISIRLAMLQDSSILIDGTLNVLDDGSYILAQVAQFVMYGWGVAWLGGHENRPFIYLAEGG